MLFENVCLAVPRGFQDYKTPSFILVFQNTTTLLLAMIITLLKGNVVGVILGTVIVTWIFSIISLIIAVIRLREMRASVVISSKNLHILLSYMAFMGLTGIGIKVFTLFDRIVVAQVLGFSAAAYYIIATGIANKFAAFASASSQALLPAFSSWNVREKGYLVWKKLLKATWIMGGATLIPGTIFLLISRPLLLAWLGVSDGEIVLHPMRILVFIYMVKTITAPSYQAANGMGFPWITALTTLIASFGTIALILYWGRRYSLQGAAWANIASWALFGIIFYLYRVLKPFKVSPE
jgi:O-antigen/teichoic acid export membrane protein